MATAFETGVRTRRTRLRFVRFVPAAVIVFFSCFYFADVILRASEKHLWFDELITYYLCRLPTFHDTWAGVLRGFDFNPPLFYLITRWSEHVFGSGLIGIRVPEIVAFWVFCVCLFIFVRRRAGILAGYIAMLFPMLTGAFYYAYEARPHGLTLGFCGLALVFWQRASEYTRRRPLWLTAFGLSIFAGCMLHCYAILLIVPFAFAEAVRVVRLRRIEWSSWLAMAIPGAAAAIGYIPLLHAYRAQAKAAGFGPSQFPPRWTSATTFYTYVLDPCILIIVAALVLFALGQSGRFSRAVSTNDAPARVVRLHELVVAVGLLALPFVGIILAKAVHGPFFNRYFLSGTAGLSIVIGFASAWRRRYGWVAIALALIMTAYLGKRFASMAWHMHEGEGTILQEPSTHIRLDTTPGKPLAKYPLLRSIQDTTEPIIVANVAEYLYLIHYGGTLVPRLYMINEFNNPIFKDFRSYCHIEGNPDYTLDDFLRTHRQFFLLTDGYSYSPLAPKIIGHGARLLKLTLGGGHSLAEYVMSSPSR